MESECSVSIIVPVYNAQKRLRLCVDSLMSQTLKNIEIILVDDGSSDGSSNLCEEYAAKDSRVKVIHLDNGGPGRARNKGMEIAAGDFIGFADADDIVELHAFETLYRQAMKTQSDIVMCGYYYDNGEELSPVSLSYEPCYEGDAIREKLLYRFYAGDNQGLYCLWNKLFRRELLSHHRLSMDESRMRGEDKWFVFDCLKAANKVTYLPESLYRYYQNSDSIMHSFFDDLYEKWVDNLKRLLEENKSLGFHIDYPSFYRAFVYKISVYCRELMQHDKSAQVKQILSDDFYLNALSYVTDLPLHIRLFALLAKLHWVKISVLLYYIWSRLG